MMQLPKCAERNRPQGVIFHNRRSATVGSAAGGKMAQNMAPVRVRLCGLFSNLEHAAFQICIILHLSNMHQFCMIFPILDTLCLESISSCI